jgi:hypothetical protein
VRAVDWLGDLDWNAITGASTALGVLVALAAVIRSERLTRDGQKLQREQADAAAARSEAAAALTEEYTQRVVFALEAMAEHGLDAGGVVARRGVVWSLTHHMGDTYLLRNEGDATAENVAISTHETLRIARMDEMPATIAPGEAGTFMASRSMATRDSTVTVSWTDPGSEDPRTWRYPLPARPPRQK